MEISFSLKPLKKGDWPSNNEFDYVSQDENGLAGYSGSKVKNNHEFTANVSGIFNFQGIAYGEKNEIVKPGPLSGTGELTVVEVVEVVPDAHAEQLVQNVAKYAAVKNNAGSQFVMVQAIFNPDVSVNQIPESFTFTGGQNGSSVDERKASRNEAKSFVFEAKLGTSVAKMDLDIVEINKISPCIESAIGLEFAIELTTKPAGYENKIAIKAADITQLSFEKKPDNKWYGKGLKMGFRHQMIGDLELATESTTKSALISICDIPIKETNYKVNIIDGPLFGTTYINSYKIPDKNVIFIGGQCDYDSISQQYENGIFKNDVTAYIKISSPDVKESEELGRRLLSQGGEFYFTIGAIWKKPVLTIGQKIKIETFVKTCDGEKMVDTKTLEVISYEDWKKNELPNIK